ncbi:major facilitator superfamily domain-containing protein [Mucor mucedo]|uniref:major facilitator superfamily domain-containing protein n=1 Tax=Mucor mucedo TaxID=29922 RepID=UPI00221E3ACB|nr:major facilitator superfamily domain-containing protein [Mucor mucedo]KAI7892801.1 major facilitator superfamily domain-containing protein [Mucor mucedo]
MSSEQTSLLQQKPPRSTRPKARRRRSSFDPATYNSIGTIADTPSDGGSGREPGLSLAQILGLTICMAGVQFTWTVELSYGTPYLLSLDLSKELTALVWLAGPLSGLLVQPLIGAFSDKCTSRFGKRRPFIVVSGFLTCLSMIGVAYAKEFGAWIARHFYSPDSFDQTAHLYAIIVAVSSFYFLDFTLNAVQAICRALILDIPPLWQQEYANAWSARMSNCAMVVGYFVGFMDLVKYFPWMGDSQIKVFCIVAMAVFLVTLAITCVLVQEKQHVETEDQDTLPWYNTLQYIWRAFRFLPKPIQSLCNTQFFAWMGWFPFLFYSTQWVSDLYFIAHPPTSAEDVNWAEGTRAGSFALLCNSMVSVVAGMVIPALVMRFEKRVWWLSLMNVYTGSQLIIAAALLSTWFIRSVSWATLVLAIMGIPWAIVLWIPFSLVGEYVSYEDEQRKKGASVVVVGSEDQQDDFDAGMILGVHNMYIVFPQFAVAIISSLIFAASAAEGPVQGKDGSNVATVLAFGGLMALIAAVASRYIVRVNK